MRSLSPEVPTYKDHVEARRKYVTLAWDLWSQQKAHGFYVWHPIPEEHLRIELALFWRGEISRIHGWDNIVGQIADAVVKPILSALTALWTTYIKPGVEAMISGVTSVVKGISTTVASISTTAASILSKSGIIQAGVSVLPTFISTGLAGVSNAVGTMFNGAVSSLFEGLGRYDITTLMGSYNNVVGQFTPAYNQVYAHTSPVTPEEALKRSVQWEAMASAAYVGINTALIIAEGLSLGQVDITPAKILDIPILRAWFETAGRMASTRDEASILIPLRQAYLEAFTPEIPSIGDATRMFWRGRIAAADFTHVILRSGLGSPWLQGYWALAEELPGARDLILFVVREVIPPSEFVTTMAMQGFSAYWSAAYWESHWILPPPERTRTAFLRKEIPEAEYRKFLIWYDFKPDPRPGISLSDVEIMLRTQYDWPARIDTRWLIEWGIITPEQGVQLIMAQGMEPTWAPKVAEAYLLNQVREELGKVRAVYEKRLREGFMSKTDFGDAMYSLHYATHVTNALLRWADEALDLDERVELADEYVKMGKDGTISLEAMAGALRDLGMVEERITRTMTHVKLILAAKAAKEAAKAKPAK